MLHRSETPVELHLEWSARRRLKSRQVLGSGNDENLADARQHQGAEQLVNYRLVVNWHQLLADSLSYRVQPRAAATGEDNSLAA